MSNLFSVVFVVVVASVAGVPGYWRNLVVPSHLKASEASIGSRNTPLKSLIVLSDDNAVPAYRAADYADAELDKAYIDDELALAPATGRLSRSDFKGSLKLLNDDYRHRLLMVPSRWSLRYLWHKLKYWWNYLIHFGHINMYPARRVAQHPLDADFA